MIAGGVGGLSTVVGTKTWYHHDRVLRALLRRHASDVPEDLFKDYTSMREFVLEVLAPVSRRAREVSQKLLRSDQRTG